MNYSSLTLLFQYFPFFIYGNIVHRYWDQAQKLMDSRWFYPVIVVVVIFAAMDTLKWHTLRMAWAILPLTLARFILLTMVVMYFRHYQEYFTQHSVMGASLQYIGRRTLDIYLIHYLFLPDLPTIGAFFDKYRHNFVLDTLTTVVTALLVIAFCIITSNILRVSPFFRKWLFGRS
jgi:surface polysaccharide O-acyltransferase-like enzyme